MPKRRKNIYLSVYTGLSMVFVLFFAHHILEDYALDVYHVNRDYTVSFLWSEYTFHVKDFFPHYTPQADDHMEVSMYLYRLGSKFLHFLLALMLLEVMKVLNIFLQDIPGRGCENLIAVLLCFVGLFAYEILDFMVFAGQTDWKWQSAVFFSVLSITTLTVKDK